MNKLYWIICEEGERTLYEGRYLGRTRGAAQLAVRAAALQSLRQEARVRAFRPCRQLWIPFFRSVSVAELSNNVTAICSHALRVEPERLRAAKGCFTAFSDRGAGAGIAY